MNHGDVADEESLDDKNRPDSPTVTSLNVTPPSQPHPPLGKTTSAMTLEMLVSLNT